MAVMGVIIVYFKYDNNKNINLLFAPRPINSMPKGNKVLRLIIEPSIKKVNSYNDCKFVLHHCANGNS